MSQITIGSLRAQLSVQANRVAKAERQMRDMQAENERMRHRIAELISTPASKGETDA